MKVATILESYSASSEYNNPVLLFHKNEGRVSTTSHGAK